MWDFTELKKYTSFEGPAIYTIINAGSLTGLASGRLSTTSDSSPGVYGSGHWPMDYGQIWNVVEQPTKGIYVLMNEKKALAAAGPDQRVIMAPQGQFRGEYFDYATETFWAIDGGLHALEEGKPVVWFTIGHPRLQIYRLIPSTSLRSVKYPGYVLELDNGDGAHGTSVLLKRECVDHAQQEKQEWLFRMSDDRPLFSGLLKSRRG
ncbi:MAG: hypothetical protein Q9209_007125 [Squamulea sp. 1 TL-2023]